MDFQEIALQFGITDPVVAVQEIHSGNINATFLVSVNHPLGVREYIFQRINTFVFTNPESVMSNILNVTEHIKQKLLKAEGTYARRVLSFLKTKDGAPFYYTAGTKHFWRVYEYVTDAVAYNMVQTPEQFYEAGRSFGEFQGWLSDFPAQTLAEIIPNFHNTPKRFKAFREAVQTDEAGRSKEVAEDVRFLLERESECSVITNALDAGKIPYRVTHNDTKINNILFDRHTQKAICVIDLDTVMPGSSLYDFGDAVRYGASTALEDERDLTKVTLSLPLYEQFTKGFLQGAQGLLTKTELELLPYSVKIMALELASRFLADYLNGDKYFKIDMPDHNLVRARTQIQLVKDIEAKWDSLCDITTKYR